MMLPSTSSVVVSEHAEQQNQYLIKLFQISELQLFQSMSMRYGFINRILALSTQRQNIWVI